MAKDRKKLQHIHSSIADKQPTPQTLEVGEIAVNNAANQEFLSIKNSDNKVKRFSSDEQIITWMEKKEVMPYEGQVRGEVGPTGTKDDKGSYGITNDDLLQNKSNIIIKLNQVVADATTKHKVVNGAKDIYNKEVNPTPDSGVTDGAGFAIDMSRYAMIGANPSFSSVTVTHQSNLSGTTNISNGAGGEVLNITTTNVNANDTNWTETITNKKSTVTAEEDKIGTLNESATTRTTTIGTDNLTVSGTTTEVHTGNVSITNSANVTATTNGTTTETKVGNVTENNSDNKQENTAGTHKLYTTGDTCINSQANANFYGNGSTNIGVACDGTKGSATTVYGTTTTVSGNTTNVTGATTLNLSGATINEKANTANTNVTSAYTSATTATTVIGTANTSATTATLSGNTLDITEATRLSAKTPSTYVSGTNLSIVETNTDIESCGRISGNTNAFTIQECAAGSGKAVINQTDIKASGKTLSFDETTSISAKTPTTTLSGTNLNVTEATSTINSNSTNLTGTNLTINESNTTINSCGKVEITTDSYSLKQCSASGGSAEFEFCNGYTVKSNAINLQQCGTAGTINITSQTQNINGGNLTINESGNTKIYSTGNTDIESTGTTYVVSSGDTQIVAHGNLLETAGGVVNLISQENSVFIASNGVNHSVDISADGNGGDVRVKAKDTLCMSAGTVAALVGLTKTNIGKNCADGGQTATLNLNGTAIYETGTTVDISGSLSANVSGASVNVSGGTINISGGSITEKSTGNTCITADSNLTIGGNLETNIGYNCAGTGIANNTRIYASTAVTINAPRTNITGNTYLSGKTYFNNTCETVDANELSDALCEVIRRGAVTIEKNTSPTDPQLATIYKFYQNGEQITNSAGTPVQIEVSKDQFLKEAVVVKNTSGEWVIRLTWWIYDPDSGTHTTATTDIDASELVHDLTAVNPDDNGTAANHNVKVSSWYDSTSGDMKFSAETTSNMHVGNMYVTGTTSASTVSGTNVNGGTISGTTVKGVSISGTNITASTAIRANNVSANTVSAATGVRANNVSADTISATTFYGKMSKSLTWSGGTFTADTTGYNGSADKVITVPTAISHLPTRGKLTITHNGLSDTYDPASDKSMTLPHSALTWQYGSVTGASSGSYNTSAEKVVTIPKNLKHLTNDLSNLTVNFGAATGQTAAATYNGSAATSITIPTSTAHLTKSTLTIDYGDVYGKTDTSYDTTAARTVTVPDSLANVSHQMVVDSTPANTGGTITIKKPINVSGTVTASGAIYSSDRNLKDNIADIDDNELDKAARVSFKSYNFKGENNKIYGVIAQDLQEIGLNEMVYTKDDDTLAVDYTSLMILEIAKLRRDENSLLEHIAWLERRIEKLESEKKD